jgi:hypothetical protein
VLFQLSYIPVETMPSEAAAAVYLRSQGRPRRRGFGWWRIVVVIAARIHIQRA